MAGARGEDRAGWRPRLAVLERALFGHDRILSLIAGDGGPRHLDVDLLGDLELHRVVADSGDGPVETAGGDHLVADLQAVLELRHLLLTLAHRRQDDEIENAEDERKRRQRQPDGLRWVLLS